MVINLFSILSVKVTRFELLDYQLVNPFVFFFVCTFCVCLLKTIFNHKRVILYSIKSNVKKPIGHLLYNSN